MAGLGLDHQFEIDFAVANHMGFIERLRVSTVTFVRWACFLGPVSGPIIGPQFGHETTRTNSEFPRGRGNIWAGMWAHFGAWFSGLLSVWEF